VAVYESTSVKVLPQVLLAVFVIDVRNMAVRPIVIVPDEIVRSCSIETRVLLTTVEESETQPVETVLESVVVTPLKFHALSPSVRLVVTSFTNAKEVLIGTS
jgi:hypothetical protein